MQELIIGALMFILLMFFPVQDSLEARNDARREQFTNIVYVAKQKARLSGYFTPEIIAELRTNLLNAFPDLDETEIYIDVTTTPKYRTNVYDERELIYFDIRIPVGRIFAAPVLFGMTEADNFYVSRRQGFVLSEVNMP